MVKKLNLTGIIAGIAIIIFSVIVFTFPLNIESPEMLWDVSTSSTSSPTSSKYEAYGGDAYTGIQNAASKTANNLIPVYNAVRDNQYSINELNKNNIAWVEAQTENYESILITIQYGIGYLLLAIGLMVIAKSFVLEIEFKRKNKLPPAQMIPQQQVPMLSNYNVQQQPNINTMQ